MKTGQNSSPARVLIIEDDKATRRMLKTGMESCGFQVSSAENGESARAALKESRFEVVVTDIVLPDARGTDLITFIKKISPSSKVLVMTAHASDKLSKECVMRGATSFLLKPFSIEQLYYAIETALTELRLLDEEESHYENLISDNFFCGMMGKSMEMRKIYHVITTVAPTDSPVVIGGETGTGKEMVAQAIHQNSERKNKELVVIDCAALSQTLLQSELFGHVKGAFTGAVKNKPGLLKLAADSTILLDEIGEMDNAAQSQLLRFLQDGKFRPVGGTSWIESNARVLAATNVDLEERIVEGAFREDLYHRLNVINIFIPPLRHRREDIPLLSYFFLRKFAGRREKSIKNISSAALSMLMGQPWSGNVRELENTISRAVTFCDGDTILPFHLSPSLKMPDERIDDSSSLKLTDAVQDAEKARIMKALRLSDGVKQEAARLLDIDRITLWRKMKQYNLEDPTAK